MRIFTDARNLPTLEADAREAIGEEAFEKALYERRRMSLDEAVEYAVSIAT